jgi:predicted lipoprotein with Yx(FWY)xxD motif
VQLQRCSILGISLVVAVSFAIGGSAMTSSAAFSVTPHGLAESDSTPATLAVTPATSPTPSPVYEVNAGKVRGLGTVLLDGQDFTLYVFAPDKQSGSSKCYGQCATAWPPLLLPSGVTKVPSGPGVKTKLLGTTKRKDGTVQVTYNKWPLYLWVIDSGPKESTGQAINNLGGKWFVINPAGTVVKKRP